MSHSKIAKLVAEVSKELQIDIPDVDRMTIMQEVRNLVKTNHPVPELMNSESETEHESDIEFVGVTENKEDEESSVSDVIEILSDDKSADSPLSIGQDVTSVNNNVGNDWKEDENDSGDVIELENSFKNSSNQSISDCEYEETVDDSPAIFADDQNFHETEDAGTRQRHKWRDLRRKFSRKNPWVTRKRRKKKSGLIYNVLKKAKGSMRRCNTDIEIPDPVVVFKRTMDKKKPWELQTISPESYMEQEKGVDNSLKNLELFTGPDTRSVTKKLSSIDGETLMKSGLGRKKQVTGAKERASFKKKTSDIIKESMKKYPGVVLKDAKVRLKDCIINTNRYKLLLNYIKEQQLKESQDVWPDLQDECKNGLFFKCGVALKDRFARNWNRMHTTPEPIRIGPKVSELVNRLASMSSELEWIETDPSKGFSDLLVHNDIANDRDVKSQSPDVYENEMDWNGTSKSSEWSSDTRGQPVLDPITGELTFVEDVVGNVKEEPIDESNSELEVKTKDSDTTKETVNDKSDHNSTVIVGGNMLGKNELTLPNRSSEVLDPGFRFPGAELIYTCTTTEGILPIEQIESAINKDIESRRGTEDTNWKQLKSTLAERVYRIEKLMGTISEENKDGEIDQFKHYALQKARAELESVKEQTGLIQSAKAANPMPTSVESTDDEASSDSNFSVSNLITNDEEEVLKAEERGLKRKRDDSDTSLKQVVLASKTNYEIGNMPSTSASEETAGEAVAMDFNMDEEFVYLRERNPIHPAEKPVRDVKFLGKFDMLIRRELYKTMLAPNLIQDDFDKAMASIMGVPMETSVPDVIEEKMNNLKIKLRQFWMNLIEVKKFRKTNDDLVKKSRIQAKSLEFLRGRIYDNLKPCILKSYTYQTICRMIIICLSEILDRDKYDIIELYHQELHQICIAEEQKKKRDLLSSQFEDIQAREAIRLRKINLQETELAKQKKKEAERQAQLEEERKKKAAVPVVIDLVEEDDETNKKTSTPELDNSNIKLVHDMLMKKMQSGGAERLEGTYSRGRGRRSRRTYKKGQSWVSPLGKDMSKVRTKPSPETIYPPSTNLQKRCPMLFFKLQQHVQSSLEKSTGALLSNAVRESLAYKIANSYALEHKEELKSLEKLVERKQATGISTEVKEGLDFIIEQNIDDDEDEDENQNTLPNIKQSCSPPPYLSGSQEQTRDSPDPGIQNIVIKREPVESGATVPLTQSAVNQPIPAITDCVAPVSASIQFIPTSSVELSSPLRPTSPLDGQSAVKTALLNRLMAGLPKVRVPLPPGWPFVTTSIPEQTKAALVDKLKRNTSPYQRNTTQSTSEGGSTAVRYPRVSFPFASNTNISQQSVVTPAATVYVPHSPQTQLGTVTSALPEGTGTLVVDATMPPAVVDATVPPTAQAPLNIKQIAKQNQQTVVQPIALQPAYVSGSGDQLFVPVFPTESTGSAARSISPTASVALVFTKLQELTTSTSEKGPKKLLGEPQLRRQYERNPTTPPLDSSVSTTSTQPSPFLHQIRPVALGCASPNLLQARPSVVTSPSSQTVRSVGTPIPAAVTRASSLPLVKPVETQSPVAVAGASSPLVRPGTTPSPLTRPVSPHSSQFCQLPIPSMQLADFLAMQLRAQIEAANKIAEGAPKGSLNLPFMNNNEEIMAALNAPILKAMDSPLLAALNSTVIKALEGSLGQAPPPVQNLPSILLTEQSVASGIGSQPLLSSSHPSTVSQPVTSQPLIISQSGIPVVSGKTVATEEKSSVLESTSETTSSSTISSVLTSVVSSLKTISTTTVSTPTFDSAVFDKDAPTTDNLSSTTYSKTIKIVKDDTTPAKASSIDGSATESKDILDDFKEKSDKEEPYEVYTYAEPVNGQAIAKVLEFLESNTTRGGIGKENAEHHAIETEEPNVTELNSKETGASVPSAKDTSDKGTPSCQAVNDDSSKDSDSEVLDIDLEEPENEATDMDQDMERYLSTGDSVTEDTATVSESEQASVCMIVTYGSLAPTETVTDSKEKGQSDEIVSTSSQGTTLRDLLLKPSVSKSPSVNPSLVNPVKLMDVGTTSSIKTSTEVTLLTSTPTSSPASITKSASSFPATTPSLGDLLSKTATAGSAAAPSSTALSSADDASSLTSDPSVFPSTHLPPALTTMRIPPGFLAAPLDGAFRVTLPDETINKIIEDAIKSVGTALTPKAQAMVRSQLDRISVPKEVPNDMKPGVMGDIAQAVVNSATDTASSGQSDFEIVDGNQASSGTRRKDPFFKLPLSGVRPIRNVAEDGTVSWTCTLCGKNFTRNFTYRRHAETHMKIKPWKCDICTKGFSDKRYLETHMRWHTGQDLQYCDECGRAFSDEYALSKHKRVHSSDRKYPCEKYPCQKVFADPHSLKRHIMHVHEQRKTHKCELCNLKFVFKSHLDDHMKRHTGEKPHHCSICGKGFIQVGTRNRHEKQHKGGKGGEPYKCSICLNIFWFKEDLRSHFYAMHPDIPVPEAHRELFMEFDEATQHEYVSEGETRIRVAHIPRERYPITSGEEDSSDTGNMSGPVPVAITTGPGAITTSPGPPELALAVDDDFIPDALAPNQQVPVLLNETETIPEIEAKGSIKDLIAATVDSIYDTTVEPVICNVETVTDPETKEHLRELVRQQEEKDRLANEAVIRPSEEEVEKDRQASETVVRLSKEQEEKDRLAREKIIRLSKQQEEKDRQARENFIRLSKQQEEKDKLAREEMIRLSKLLYKKDTESSMQKLINSSNLDSNSLFDQFKSIRAAKSSTENISSFPVQVKTEPMETELSVNASDKEMESASNKSGAAKQYLGNLMKPQSSALSQIRTTNSAERNTEQLQCVPNIKDISKVPNIKDISKVPNIKDISKGIHSKVPQSAWLQTKTKIQAQTDKIESLMELFREKGVPKEETVSVDNESEDSD